MRFLLALFLLASPSFAAEMKVTKDVAFAEKLKEAGINATVVAAMSLSG